MLSFARCPVCRTVLPWTYIWRPVWARWNCASCGSLLGISPWRRVLIIGLVIPLGLFWMPFMSRAGVTGLFGSLIALVVLLLVLVGLLLAVDRVVVIERCGLRCKHCGYDLQGQREPRCPECGNELDAEQRSLLASGEIPTTTHRKSRTWAVLIAVLVIAALFTLATAGLITYKKMRAAPRIPATTQPVGPGVP